MLIGVKKALLIFAVVAALPNLTLKLDYALPIIRNGCDYRYFTNKTLIKMVLIQEQPPYLEV